MVEMSLVSWEHEPRYKRGTQESVSWWRELKIYLLGKKGLLLCMFEMAK